MEYVSEPNVYLVSRPSVDWQQVADLLSNEGVPPIPESIRAGDDESAAIVEISARMCYMSFGRGRKDISDFVENLLSKGDGSVLEHVNYGFVFTGVSRSLPHELVRHSAGFAYSQRSQRYVESEDQAGQLFTELLNQASSSYEKIVSALEKTLPKDMFPHPRDHRKAVRQAARSVLPNATETKIFVTGNVRAWRHFIQMRGADFADWEIRSLALKVLNTLEKESPLLFGDFKIETLPDGTEIATPKYSRV